MRLPYFLVQMDGLGSRSSLEDRRFRGGPYIDSLDRESILWINVRHPEEAQCSSSGHTPGRVGDGGVGARLFCVFNSAHQFTNMDGSTGHFRKWYVPLDTFYKIYIKGIHYSVEGLFLCGSPVHSKCLALGHF